MKYAVLLLVVMCSGCLRKGIDVDVDVQFDDCYSAYPACIGVTDDAGTHPEPMCLTPDGHIAANCVPACLLGLGPVDTCPVVGQCFNNVAGQELEVPTICTRR